MSNQIYQQLSEPFPPEMERSLSKSGTNLVYIPVSEVINRLNKVLGVDKWSFHVVSVQRDSADTDFVLAHVRISYLINDYTEIVRDGFGGQKIKRNKQGGIVDLGDEFKGAISDALKKAAQTLGVGLYLARSDDAMEVEQFIDSEIESRQLVSVSDEVSSKWDSFVGLTKALSAEKKELLNSFWSKHSNGKPKPKKETVSEQDLDVLIAEATRLSFDGEYSTSDDK